MTHTMLAPTPDELRTARDILRRKAAFDIDLAREAAEVRSDYATFDAYVERAARFNAAVEMIDDCLAGILRR